MKIVFTGAQGTGKTTILNEFSGSIEVITEVVRILHKNGVKINEVGDDEGQELIFNTYKKLLNEKANYISDRCLVDVFAYTKYLYNEGKVSKEVYIKQYEELKEFISNNKDIVYIYFPIEFDLVDDGVRSLNNDFRSAIDNNILNTLNELNVNYLTMRGGIEERVRNMKFVMSI